MEEIRKYSVEATTTESISIEHNRKIQMKYYQCHFYDHKMPTSTRFRLWMTKFRELNSFVDYSHRVTVIRSIVWTFRWVVGKKLSTVHHNNVVKIVVLVDKCEFLLHSFNLSHSTITVGWVLNSSKFTIRNQLKNYGCVTL